MSSEKSDKKKKAVDGVTPERTYREDARDDFNRKKEDKTPVVMELTYGDLQAMREQSIPINIPGKVEISNIVTSAVGALSGTTIYQDKRLSPLPEDPEGKNKWIGTKFEGKSASQIVMDNNNYTIQVLLPLWMDNYGKNLQDILYGLDVSQIPRRDTSAIIVGAGPSIKQLNQLEQLKESGYKGTIITTDRMLVECLRLGIIPEFVCATDGDPSKVAQFFNHKTVAEYASKINLVVITTIHPSVVAKWKEVGGGKIYWFNAFLDDPDTPTSLTKSMHFMNHKIILHVPGNCGAFCWNLAITIGANPICLIGMDYGYLEDTPLEQTSYYYKFMATYNNNLEEVKKLYKEAVHPHFGSKYRYDIMWDGYKTMFLPYLRKAAMDMGIKTISCSPCHLWDAVSIENMHFTGFLKKYKK